MIYLKKHFHELYRHAPEKIKHIKENGDELSAEVYGEHVDIVFKQPYILTRCECGQPKCYHVYTLLRNYTENIYRQDNLKLKKSKYKINKYFKETLNGEKVEKHAYFESISDNVIENFKVLEKEKYIEMAEILSEYDYDAYLNHGYRRGNMFENELYTLIFFHLDFLIYSEEYEISFEIMKILCPHIIKLESADKELNEYVKKLIEQFDIIIKGSKKTPLQEEIFNWLTEVVQIPYVNKLSKNLRSKFRNKFNKNEQKYLKEELSLHILQNIDKYRLEQYFNVYSGYNLMKLGSFPGYLEESEYWVDFHLSILKKLKADEQEKIEFLKHYSKIPPARDKLMKYYTENNIVEGEIELLKEHLDDTDMYTVEYRLSLLERIIDLDEDFYGTDEYIKYVEGFLFDDGILHPELIEDYITKNPNKKDIDYFLNIINKEGLHHYNYGFKDLKKFLENIELDNEDILDEIIYSEDVNLILKHGDKLIKEEPEEFLDTVQMLVIEWLKYQESSIKDADKVLKFLIKYPEAKEQIDIILDYCEESDNKKIYRLYKKYKNK